MTTQTPAPAERTVDIATMEMTDGTFSYSFEIEGKFYTDHDYTTRESALEYARSKARAVFAKATGEQP
jgi:hypothetical protein